jgi:hypothetical protein
MSAADFEPAKARCSLLARHSGSDFTAFGSESYVAGAAVGHVIGESVRTQQDFNDCMLAGGWRIADQPNAAAPQDPRIARLKEIRAELTTCINAIRAKPIYASLQPHLIDLNIGRYTMAQLADERIPTPEESRLLSAYVDERDSCTDNFAATGSQILPAAAPILAQERSDGQALLVLLVKRQLTWGEAAQRSQQLQEANAAKLRTMTLPALGPSASTPSPAPVAAATPVVTRSGPAPAAPEAPSAVSVPAVHSESSAPRTKERTVASGERQRIDYYVYLNPDCTAVGYDTVRIIKPPTHGELTTELGVGYTNYSKENQRYQCNLRQSPMINVYYKSTFGYLGADSTLIEVTDPLAVASSIIYTITVR